MSLIDMKKLEKNIRNDYVMTVYNIHQYVANKHNNFKKLLDSEDIETINEVKSEAMNDKELRDRFLALSY